jgi:microcystin-dependent protein
MDTFIGSIEAFGFNFAPRDWAMCQGQLLSITQNAPLHALLGNMYGGDGRTTFALLDLRGRAPIGQGSGPGLSAYTVGQSGGVESVVLNQIQMPTHAHVGTGKLVTSNTATGSTPVGAFPAPATERVTTGAGAGADGGVQVSGWGTGVSGFGADNGVTVTNGNTGGNLSHENRMPYLAINWCICMQGLFPPRS